MGFIDRFDSLKGLTKFRSSSLDTVSATSNSGSEGPGKPIIGHAFENPDTAKHWIDIYEDVKYESRHHVDPEFTWQTPEEKKIIRKTDWYVTFWAFIMFVGLNIDRYNMANATAGTLLEDLKLTTNDYNLGNTVNLVCFLGAELPSQLVSKWLGPDRWIPMQLTLWSIVSITQCKMSTRGQFLATRGLIGALEGGFIPDVSLWMSYFYKNNELSVRFAWFYIANPFTQAVTGLLSAAIFTLHDAHGMRGWQWIFLIEGLITLVIGLFSFFKMPASVVQTKTWFRRSGWFTEREEKIMVNRVIRDDPSKGTLNNRQPIDLLMLWKSLLDYDLWPLYVTRLSIDIIATPLAKYASILLKGEHFSTAINNLLQVPYAAFQIITMVSVSHGARRFKQFGWFLTIPPLWLLPCLVAMRWWPEYQVTVWPSYIVLFFALSYPPSWPITIAWTSENSNSVRTRSVSAALVNMFSQSATIIGSNLFRKDDAPFYKRGLQQDFAICIAAIVVTILARYYYVLKNKSRDCKWNSMSADEQLDYTLHTTDEGNKRLDFRFSY